MNTPTPSDAAMSPEEVNAFIQAIASNPDAQILLTQDGQGKMLKMAALIRLCGEVAKQATPLREELARVKAERDNYKRSVENAHEELDKSELLRPRSVTHQGLTPRIASLRSRSEDQITILRASNDKLLEVVLFYADAKRYETQYSGIGESPPDILSDGGERARALLFALAPERKETT